jgi:hypothetical protein
MAIERPDWGPGGQYRSWSPDTPVSEHETLSSGKALVPAAGRELQAEREAYDAHISADDDSIAGLTLKPRRRTLLSNR